MSFLSTLKHSFFGLVALAACDLACAQGLEAPLPQLNHRAFTLQSGAPGFVAGLAQTSDGILWLGGTGGLTSFDGARFTSYPEPGQDPLPTSKVSTLHATPDGGLWIGHTTGGVSFLKKGHVTFHSEPDAFPEGRSVRNFATDPDGVLWVATTGSLARFDGQRWHVDPDAARLQMPLRGVLIDRLGTQWVAASRGVSMRPRGEARFREVVTGMFGGRMPGGIPIAESPSGEIWIARRHELIRIKDASTLHDIHVLQVKDSEVPVRGWLSFDRQGNLWMPGSGLSRVRSESLLKAGALEAEHLSPAGGFTHDSAFAFLQDREGNVWIGTSGGLDRFSPSNLTRYPIECQPGAFVPGPGSSVWISCEQAGATTLSRDGHVLASHPTPEFTAAYRDADGTVWFAGRSVLARIGIDRAVLQPLPTEAAGADVQAMVRDNEGVLWVSVMTRGLFRLKNGDWSAHVELPDLPRSPPWVASLAPDGALWFGYLSSKVARVKNGRVTVFDRRDGLDVGNVMSMSVQNGDVLVGGELGFARMEGQRFVTLREFGGIPMRGIAGVVRTRSGDVWLHTISGISRFALADMVQAQRDAKYRPRVDHFNHLDGLPGTAFQLRPLPAAMEGDDGRIWFSTEAGIVSIDPRRPVRNTLPPPVRVWTLSTEGKRYRNDGKRIMLPALTNALRISYSAASFTVPERVRFRYRVEGLDHEWQEAGNRHEAVYTNLGPGDYRFRVIAANNDGVWNNVGASLDFSIAPALYQTRWFYAFCVMATLLLLLALYRLRVATLSRRLALETAANQENARLYHELQERESRVRRLISSNIVGVFTWSLDGRILEANDAFGRIVGYGSDDIASGRLNWKDLIPPGWDPDDDPVMERLLATGVAPPFEAQYVRKDGSQVPVWVGAALFDQTTEGVAFVLDLTDLKLAEEAARESDRRYHEMERLLSDANRVASIAQLSATIAHEINQPLSGVMTNASTALLMLDANPPNIEGARETARRTLRDGNRAADVIARLRALFSGQAPLLEPLDINDATREVIAMMASDIDKCGAVVHLDLAEQLPRVSGDRIQLQQVVLNLLRNALQAMTRIHDRTRRVVIRTEGHHDCVRVCVRDAGVGLNPSDADKLFNAFYSKTIGGMGVGLSISRSIIERHQGRIWAERNADHGATFFFSIPRSADTRG